MDHRLDVFVTVTTRGPAILAFPSNTVFRRRYKIGSTGKCSCTGRRNQSFMFEVLATFLKQSILLIPVVDLSL